MDVGRHNPPEASTVNVEISSLLGGFIWPCGGIIPWAGIFYLKVLYVMAGENAQGLVAADAMLASASTEVAMLHCDDDL
jgi:hypothetical protein